MHPAALAPPLLPFLALARLLLILPLLVAPAASADTWHVLPDGTGDAPTIQAAVDSSAAGDSVLVAAGFYVENVVTEPGRILIGSWNETFSLSDVELHPSTVDGDSAGPCITADFAEQDPLGQVSGFRLIGGAGHPIDTWVSHGGGLYAIGLWNITDLVVEECEAIRGAGLYVEADRPELAEIVARINSLGYGGTAGGGLYLAAGEEGRVTRSLFESNGKWQYGDTHGLGVFLSGPRVRMDSCSVSGGYGDFGSQTSCYGAGIYAECDSLILLDCEIFGNRPRSRESAVPTREPGLRGLGYGAGGGVYCTTARIQRCLIRNNGAAGYWDGAGGGIHIDNGLIEDCVITENAGWGGEDTGRGGGIAGGDITVRNCRVENNWTFGGTIWGSSGGIGAGTLRIENTAVRGNTSFGGRNASTAGISAGTIEAFNITVTGNHARAGTWGSNHPYIIAGVAADDGHVSHSIITRNTYSGPTPQITGGLGGEVESRHNLFWENTGDAHADLLVAEAHVYADPLFADSTLRLALHSPAIDRGDPARLDPDGSVADLGAYGGPDADMAQPDRVTGLTATRTPAGIELEWDANAAPDLDGYAIYRLASNLDHPGLANFVSRTTGTSFVDAVGPPHPHWIYRVSAFDVDQLGGGYSEPVTPGDGTGLTASTAPAPEPAIRRLGANPTRGPVEFELNSPDGQQARLEVFDVLGRRVWSETRTVSAGTSRLAWTGQNGAAQSVAAGTYFIRLYLGDVRHVERVVVAR